MAHAILWRYAFRGIKLIKRKAFAKINLALDILGKRSDGYHTVRMIMQTIDLYDTVTVDLLDNTSPRVSFSVDIADNKAVPAGIPTGDDNLCVRAANALIKRSGIRRAVSIHLTKRIPAEAGLAGGSTDAAAVLSGLNELLNIDYTIDGLSEIAVPLGADIPYCLRGGTMLAEGIGEELSGIEPQADGVAVVLIKPDFGMSTGMIYTQYDSLSEHRHPDIDGLIDLIQRRRLIDMKSCAGNVLEEVAVKIRPEISDVKTYLNKSGAFFSSVTGSGPTVYGLFSDKAQASFAAQEAKSSFPGYFVYNTVTV